MKTLKLFVVFFLSLFITSTAAASSQVGERLIYNGDTIEISEFPLYDINQKLYQLLKDKFGLDMYETVAFSIARGYIGTWEIADGKLYLVKLTFTSFDNISLKDIFEDKCVDGKVQAYWYNGSIFIPKGKFLRYDGVACKTFYTEEQLVFRRGIVKKSKLINNYTSVPNAIERHYNIYDKDYNDEDDGSFPIDIGRLKVKQSIIDYLNLNIQALKPIDLSDFELFGITIIIGPEGTVEDVFRTGGESTKDTKRLKRIMKALRFDIVRFKGHKYKERVYLKWEYDGKYLYLIDD